MPTSQTIFRFRPEPNGAVLMRCDPAEGRVRVPERALGLDVVGIADRAFSGAERMTGIDLPGTLETIGAHAFFGCAALQAIALPGSLRRMGSGAFEGCPALREATFGDGLESLPDRAFYLCRALRRVRLPATLRRIGESCFDGCAALEAAALPEGLSVVARRAFADCAALRAIRVPLSVSQLDVTSLPAHLHRQGGLYLPGSGLLVKATARLRWSAPAGTRIIADGALAGNHDLTDARLPDTVARIGARAFADCRCLHHINLPEGVRLGEGAFHDCHGLRAIALPRDCGELPEGLFEASGLETVALPERVTAIGPRCFARCEHLTEIRLNSGLRRVGGSAFAHCGALQSIALPESVEAVGPQAFLDCRSLETLTVFGGIPRGLETALTDLRRVVILAPRLTPEAFPPLWRRRVCLGFARAAAEGVPIAPDVFDANLDWMRAHASVLAADAAADPALLRLMLDHRCLSDRDAQRLVERMDLEDRRELTVELLNYIQRPDAVDDALW